MKKLIADMHMHTLVSGHAYGTIREMAATAGEKNLKLIGITEHAPGIPGTWSKPILRSRTERSAGIFELSDQTPI